MILEVLSVALPALKIHKIQDCYPFIISKKYINTFRNYITNLNCYLCLQAAVQTHVAFNSQSFMWSSEFITIKHSLLPVPSFTHNFLTPGNKKNCHVSDIFFFSQSKRVKKTYCDKKE